MFEASAPLLVGANLPWIRYGCDFGANRWHPDGGLASQPAPDRAVRALTRLRASGATHIRWFVFCDGRAGIRFDGKQVEGLDACVLPDVAAALTLAEATDLRVVFTLFDFHWCQSARHVNGVQLGGRRAVLGTSRGRAGLLDRVVAPVFREFGDHPCIAAWDVINEPEWVTLGVGSWNPFVSVRRHTMRSFIRDVTSLAHDMTTQPVTVGSASARWLPLVQGVGLDFFQVHWYDRVARHVAPQAVSTLDADRPVVLGEFPTRGSALDPSTLLRLADDGGYRGALWWSLLAEDEATNADGAFQALAARRDRAPAAGRV
jgi:hypothetical protein